LDVGQCFLPAHTIVLALGGSQAHGTAGPDSDIDLRGVCIAPLSLRLSLHRTFDQREGPLPPALAATTDAALRARVGGDPARFEKVECAIYDVAKFLRLCEAANPNALELLFTDPGDWLLATPAWERVHSERHRLLTRKVQQTFLGYAMAQLTKIRNHRAWLLQPPKGPPTRAAFGLPEQGGRLSRDEQDRIERAIAEKRRAYSTDDIDMTPAARIEVRGGFDAMRQVAVQALAIPAEVAASLEAERRYRAAKRGWRAYETWKRERNPKRAALERAHGYDTKHAMHLVRLMRMGLEALQDGTLTIRRPDADELCAIRAGAWSFERLLEETAAIEAAMQVAAERTALPATVDGEWLDALAFDLMLSVP
jgi:predicted nucleotidyltransferase